MSEWWLEPRSTGPGPHSHESNEEIFLVMEGTMTFRAGDKIVEAPAGSFLRVPAGVIHDFENRSDSRSGIFNVCIPGGFEEKMPEIVAWFAKKTGW